MSEIENSIQYINNKPKDPGQIYFIRFDNAKNCYKIGLTNNVWKRLYCIGNNNIELIMLGTAQNKLKVEKELQYKFIEYSNNYTYHRFLKNKPIGSKQVVDYQYAGDMFSMEHFIFPHTSIVCEVICAFEELCDEVQLGTTHPDFCSKDHRLPIGFGEERLKFYHEPTREYCPYPTKFADQSGFPIHKDREEWDSIPYVGLEPEYKEIIIHRY